MGAPGLSLFDTVYLGLTRVFHVGTPTARQDPDVRKHYSASPGSRTPHANWSEISYFTTVISGCPFSAKYVASSAPLPLPMFFTEWTVPAGTNKTSPGLTVTDLPSI